MLPVTIIGTAVYELALNQTLLCATQESATRIANLEWALGAAWKEAAAERTALRSGTEHMELRITAVEAHTADRVTLDNPNATNKNSCICSVFDQNRHARPSCMTSVCIGQAIVERQADNIRQMWHCLEAQGRFLEEVSEECKASAWPPATLRPVLRMLYFTPAVLNPSQLSAPDRRLCKPQALSLQHPSSQRCWSHVHATRCCLARPTQMSIRCLHLRTRGRTESMPS